MRCEMKGIEEHRRQERHEVQGVQGSILIGIKVEVLNMSRRGIAVESDERMIPGVKYTMRLEGGRAVWIDGAVVWAFKTWSVNSDTVDTKYRAGMKLISIISDADAQFSDFIIAHKKISPP
jgi:hypothetical protein